MQATVHSAVPPQTLPFPDVEARLCLTHASQCLQQGCRSCGKTAVMRYRRRHRLHAASPISACPFTCTAPTPVVPSQHSAHEAAPHLPRPTLRPPAPLPPSPPRRGCPLRAAMRHHRQRLLSTLPIGRHLHRGLCASTSPRARTASPSPPPSLVAGSAGSYTFATAHRSRCAGRYKRALTSQQNSRRR